jgi:hypothetical protein
MSCAQRRDFLIAVGTILASPLVAEAQQAPRVPRIGVLLAGKTGTGMESFREGFRIWAI